MDDSETTGESANGQNMRHGRGKKRRKTVRNGIILGVVAVLVLAAGAAAFYVLNTAKSFDDKRVVAEEVFPDETSRPPAAEPESPSYDAQNVLLLGVDLREEMSDDIDEVGGGRADAIMVMHIPSDRDEVQIMSIMRDNWVPIEGHGHAKINAALAYGGIPLMVSTVENFIDMRIDHVAVIDFDGFQGLTDALGGVEVDSEESFTTRDHAFDKGKQTLDGDEALSFVRERKAFTDGDYQRARNQQAYMRGVIARLLSRDVLTSPGKISDSVDAFAPFLTVDEELNSRYLAGLGYEMRKIRNRDIHFFTSPTLGTGWEDSQSIVEPDWEEIDVLREHFAEDTVSDYTAPSSPSQ